MQPVIIRRKNEQELSAQACNDIVEYGQMNFVWVGLINRKTQDITSVACACGQPEYLNGLHINTRPAQPAGLCPAGWAIRENRPVRTQDFPNGSSLERWREHIRQFN